MSWLGYIQSLVKEKYLDTAAICGFDGKIWGSSENFKPTKNEIKILLNGFKNPNKIRASGFDICRRPHFVLVSESNRIYGRDKEGGKNSGVCVSKTNKALIIGHYKKGMAPGNASMIVEKIADYLKKKNY